MNRPFLTNFAWAEGGIQKNLENPLSGILGRRILKDWLEWVVINTLILLPADCKYKHNLACAHGQILKHEQIILTHMHNCTHIHPTIIADACTYKLEETQAHVTLNNQTPQNRSRLNIKSLNAHIRLLSVHYLETNGCLGSVSSAK